MKKGFAAFALSLAVVAGTSAHSITFYFGQPEYITTAEDFVPDDGYPPPLSGTNETVTLGLWAVPGFDWASPPDIWQGININIVTTGDVTIEEVAMSNFNHGMTWSPAYRWETGSDFGGASPNSDMFLVGVQTFGLGGMLPSPLGSPADRLSYIGGDMGTGTLRYWLGNVTLWTGYVGGLVFLQVGDSGIARRGGDSSVDLVYFGLDGDAPLHGNEFGALTPTPEYGIPEPASALLLSLAALVRRRR